MLSQSFRLNCIILVSEMRHQNVLRYFGAWCEVDKLFMGYELAEKGKLDEYLRQTRLTGNAVSNMSNYQVMKILVNIVEGLAHLHGRGIIHGNLQGKNRLSQVNSDRVF